jgi:hypothetical protein
MFFVAGIASRRQRLHPPAPLLLKEEAMAEPLRNPKNSAPDTEPARSKPLQPTESQTHGMEREPEVSLGQQIRARVDRRHKGDVGLPGTNEEIFQGSKVKELF